MIDVYKMKVNEEHIKGDLDTYQTTMNGRAFLSIDYRLPLVHHLSQPHIEIDNFGLSNPRCFFH